MWRRRGFSRSVLAAVLLALTVPGGAATGDEATADEAVIAREARPTAVSAHAGTVVWSSWSRSARRYRLVAWDERRGRRTLPARPQPIPFDADVGPSRDGRPSVVYSRCRRPPLPDNGANTLPVYTDGRACDLYQVAASGRGREHRIDKLSQRGATEVLPSIWRAGVAFARIYERRPRLEGSLPRLMLGSLRSNVATRELPGGTHGVYEAFDAQGPYYGGPGPTGIDLDGRRVAFVWDSQADSCRPGDEGDLDHLQSEVWIDSIDGEQQLLERICEGETDRFFSPALTPERLFYVRKLNNTSFDGLFRSYAFETGSFAESPVKRKSVSIARGGDITYFSRFVQLFERTEIVRSTDDDAAR